MISSTVRAAIAAAILATAPCAFTAPAVAQANPPAAPALKPMETPVIMVVDIQKILQESLASKGIQKTVESQRDTYQKEISALEDKLRTAEQELRKQQTVLSPDALAQRRRDFEKQVAELQRTVQNRKRSLDTALNQAMGEVQKRMLEIVAELARDRGANIVLARHQFVIVEQSLDVTEAVLTRLNKELPKVAVNIPKP